VAADNPAHRRVPVPGPTGFSTSLKACVDYSVLGIVMDNFNIVTDNFKIERDNFSYVKNNFKIETDNFRIATKCFFRSIENLNDHSSFRTDREHCFRCSNKKEKSTCFRVL
jgi:hypothetical protein